jgi:hypothetical protein
MSDLDIRAIRVALADDAASVAGVKHALSYVPTKIDARLLPLVVIGNPEAIEYNRLFGSGHATITLRVTVLVSDALDPERATVLLDEFVSQESGALATALRQGSSSASSPWTVSVESADSFGSFQFESTQYLGCQLVVEVRT